MLGALFGYAVGTVQVLFLDWFRARVSHARHLRLLRADLRNAATFNRKFGWTTDGIPEDDSLPRPPVVSTVFLSTLAQTDFTLTDEHEDDNSQQSLMAAWESAKRVRPTTVAALTLATTPEIKVA